MKAVYPITLTVFFPTFNEEDTIVQTIVRAQRVLEESPYIQDYEILVVDDGSNDDTSLLVSQLEKRHPRVRSIRHETNQGYGAAIRSGMGHASKGYVFFTDADMQFNIIELQSLLAHLPWYDVVIGYRAPRRDSFFRHINARIWNILNRLLFGLRVRDIDCAFKLFKRDVIEKTPLQSSGVMINAEMLIRLHQQRIAIKEVPVSHQPRMRGSSSNATPLVIIRAFLEMLILYRGGLGPAAHKQAFRFILVGIINTLLDLLVYITLTRTTLFFSEHLIVAKSLSFFVGTISSLVFNRYWTFELKSFPRIDEITRFYIVISLSLLVNVSSMQVLLTAGLYDLLALLITTVFTFAIGFTLSRLWVFKTPRQKQLPANLMRHTNLP